MFSKANFIGDAVMSPTLVHCLTCRKNPMMGEKLSFRLVLMGGEDGERWGNAIDGTVRIAHYFTPITRPPRLMFA